MDWKDANKQVQADAGGMIETCVYNPEQIDEVLVRAAFGDATALRRFGLISNTAVKIYGAPREAPALCLTCPRPAQRWGEASASYCGIATTRRRGSAPACACGAHPCGVF